MDFLIGQHVLQGKERERRIKKENVVTAKPPPGPPHILSHLQENVVIFLMSSWIKNFHCLNPLHMLLEAYKVF